MGQACQSIPDFVALVRCEIELSGRPRAPNARENVMYRLCSTEERGRYVSRPEAECPNRQRMEASERRWNELASQLENGRARSESNVLLQ